MGVKPKGGSTLQTGNSAYEEITLTTSYQTSTFGFPATKVSIANDSDSDTVQVSWDGATVHYELQGAEYKDINAGGRSSVQVKGTAGGDKVRVSAE